MDVGMAYIYLISVTAQSSHLAVIIREHVPTCPYQLYYCLQFSISGANWMTQNFPHQILHASDSTRILVVCLCWETDPDHVPGVGGVGRHGAAHSDLID